MNGMVLSSPFYMNKHKPSCLVAWITVSGAENHYGWAFNQLMSSGECLKGADSPAIEYNGLHVLIHWTNLLQVSTCL